jgi:DNA replication and repair protein RecF
VAFHWVGNSVHLTHLSLTNFRNFTRLDLEVPCGPLLLVGDNAQGKTSLLEAVYFLATFASFHASNERQLINFFAIREPLAVARIQASFERAGAQHRLEVRVIQEPSGGSLRLRKEILLDGVKRKLSEVVGQFNAVLFLPQMLGVIEGAPEERRRYLNLALAQVIPGYSTALAGYNRALTQRNALLKQLNERGGNPTQLDYWDEQLVAFGAQILHARIWAVQELERLAAHTHAELTRDEEVLRFNYQPAYDPLTLPPRQFTLPIDAMVDRSKFSISEICTGFLDKLVQLRNEEISRGITTIGPHRDELRLLSNGIDLGHYGSRGQVRSALMSLKLAEVGWMKDKSGQWPVLLLDEVLAELDGQRRSDLLSRLAESEQSLMTTTDLDLFAPEFVHKARLWQVKAGRVEEVINAT